jgi:hypothetical protein
MVSDENLLQTRFHKNHCFLQQLIETARRQTTQPCSLDREELTASPAWGIHSMCGNLGSTTPVIIDLDGSEFSAL